MGRPALESSRERLMGVMDELNHRYGRGTVKLTELPGRADGVDVSDLLPFNCAIAVTP